VSEQGTLDTIRQPNFNLPVTMDSAQLFPDRPRPMLCKSTQMGSCPFIFLWLWPVTDHKPHSWHVPTKKLWAFIDCLNYFSKCLASRRCQDQLIRILSPFCLVAILDCCHFDLVIFVTLLICHRFDPTPLITRREAVNCISPEKLHEMLVLKNCYHLFWKTDASYFSL